MSPYYSHRLKGQNDEKKNKFFLTKEMTRKPRQPSRSKSDEKEEVLVVVDASPLLLKKTSIDKPESVGVLSDDKESITSVDDPQDQTVLVSSMSQDVEDTRQAQAQGRRLLDEATFLARCESTSGLTGSNAYVDCIVGFVSGTSTTCADACGDDCCTGANACVIFTGKGEQRVILHIVLF